MYRPPQMGCQMPFIALFLGGVLWELRRWLVKSSQWSRAMVEIVYTKWWMLSALWLVVANDLLDYRHTADLKGKLLSRSCLKEGKTADEQFLFSRSSACYFPRNVSKEMDVTNCQWSRKKTNRRQFPIKLRQNVPNLEVKILGFGFGSWLHLSFEHLGDKQTMEKLLSICQI